MCRWRPSRPTVPAPIRCTFTIAGVSAFLAWTVTALFLALMPSYVTQVAGTSNLALTGGIVTLMLGCAASAQIPLRRLPTLEAQTIGLSPLVIGLAGIIAAAQTGLLAVVFIATVLTGARPGLAFSGSLAEVNPIAPARRPGELISSYYVVIYIGVALPIIGSGSFPWPPSCWQRCGSSPGLLRWRRRRSGEITCIWL